MDRGTFGTFERSLNLKAYGYAIIDDPTGSAPAPLVERFEVRDGDCAAQANWSDCATDRERSELSEVGMQIGEWWYQWWIFLPKDFPVIFPAKTVLGQFHQRNGPPAFMFQNMDGGYWVDRNFGATMDLLRILTDEEMRGRWNQIEVHARWHPIDGFFHAYANGTKRYTFEGTTMTAAGIYFKYGIYRSFVSRFKSANQDRPLPTQVVLFANVMRTRSRLFGRV